MFYFMQLLWVNLVMDTFAHDVIIGWITRRLNDENVLSAHVFQYFHHDLTVTEAPDNGFAHRDMQMFGDCLRQLRVRIAREYHHSTIGHGFFILVDDDCLHSKYE